MDSRIDYHRSIAKRYQNELPEKIRFDSSMRGLDEVILNSTEIKTDSKVGVVIIPGMTVPRESYYKVMLALSNYNVLVFDLRGQSFSGGEMNIDGCVNDINLVGENFKKQKGLEYLVGIGHSFGGLSLLKSSTESNHPYDLRISVAAPVDMKKIAGWIPGNGGVIGSTMIYLYNLKNNLENPAFKDVIVKEYEHMFFDFLKDPRIVSLRVKNPSAFNDTRNNSPILTEFVRDVKTPSYFIYPGHDERLRIEGRFEREYGELYLMVKQKGMEINMLPKLSHRFNFTPETQFALSYDNYSLMNEIERIMKKEVGR